MGHFVEHPSGFINLSFSAEFGDRPIRSGDVLVGTEVSLGLRDFGGSVCGVMEIAGTTDGNCMVERRRGKKSWDE